jgi:hypothetical protein
MKRGSHLAADLAVGSAVIVLFAALWAVFRPASVRRELTPPERARRAGWC